MLTSLAGSIAHFGEKVKVFLKVGDVGAIFTDGITSWKS